MKTKLVGIQLVNAPKFDDNSMWFKFNSNSLTCPITQAMNISAIQYSVILLFITLGYSMGEIVISTTPQNWQITSHSLTETEARIAAIDNELSQLARSSLRSGIGSVGYRSDWHTTDDVTEWVEIDLGDEHRVDSIVLVPNLFRDSLKGFQSDGFPHEFRIIAGSEKAPKGRVIAECIMTENDLPRIAPVIINIQPTQASWVRVEATKLGLRAFDQYYTFQLAELMVFSKSENIALNQPVSSSTPPSTVRNGWSRAYINDGAIPYLLDATRGSSSVAYLSPRYAYLLPGETLPELTVDLGQSYSLDRIHLHAIDQSDTVPQVYIGNHAIPEKLHIIGANQSDFSDAVTLLRHHKESPDETKPILMLRFPETNCRYIKLIAERPKRITNQEWRTRLVGFAEIECFADGKNVALGKAFSDNFAIRPHVTNRTLSALTDGRNLYGQILPLRQWMEELARRHELELERPVVEAARQRAYAQQKVRLQWVSWLAAILAVGILIIVLIERIIHLRQIAQIKERFAADLHDELGANVHTIGLLSDAAQDSHENEADWRMLHKRIRDLSERTGTAIRHCTNMLDARKLYFGITDDMKRVARRNMANYEHTMTIEGETYLSELKPRTRVDLFLFYKECLVNISRHSGATRFATELIADAKGLKLTISDNGKGLSNLPNGKIPGSLKRRARLLKATLQVETVANEGTRIILTHKHRRFPWKRTG